MSVGSYQEALPEKSVAEKISADHVSGTVLIIDDEPWVGEAVADILQMEGLKTYRATRGQDGLDLYKQYQADIDLVLLDLMMPEMNGEEVFLALRELDPQVKVILSSGYSEAEATRRFVGRRLASFIQKPYDFDTLTQRIRAVMAESLDPAP